MLLVEVAVEAGATTKVERGFTAALGARMGGLVSFASSAVMTSIADSSCPSPVLPSYPFVYHLDPHELPYGPPVQAFEAPVAEVRNRLPILPAVYGAITDVVASHRAR